MREGSYILTSAENGHAHTRAGSTKKPCLHYNVVAFFILYASEICV